MIWEEIGLSAEEWDKLVDTFSRWTNPEVLTKPFEHSGKEREAYLFMAGFKVGSQPLEDALNMCLGILNECRGHISNEELEKAISAVMFALGRTDE